MTPCARKNQRIMLPGINDMVFDSLDLLATQQEVSAFVLDVADAFWSLPLRRKERRFFIGRLRGVYYAFRRLAQGSRGAPLVWCRFFALVARLTQAMHSSSAFRLNTYVDDPMGILAGVPAARDMATAATVLAWRLLNLRLAFRKGQRGNALEWIGFKASISCTPNFEEVTVSLKQETQAELLAMIEEFWSKNILSLAELRSFSGKVCNGSRLLLGWRPFLFELWGALKKAERSRTRRVWTKQVRPALQWFRAFLSDEALGITRTFRLSAYLRPSDAVTITVDASPFGMGAFISWNGTPREFFAVPISDDDVEILGHQRGDCAGQQTWECLTAVVALRQWRDFWHEDRTALTVRGDNGSLLTMIDSYKTTGPGTSIVGRELALLTARGCYKPSVALHLPGVANVVSDLLSRRFQDPKEIQWRPHEFLADAVEVHPPRRDRSWYRALVPPSATPPAAVGKAKGRRQRRGRLRQRPAAAPQ